MASDHKKNGRHDGQRVIVKQKSKVTHTYTQKKVSHKLARKLWWAKFEASGKSKRWWW